MAVPGRRLRGVLLVVGCCWLLVFGTRTRTNTNPNGTEANAAGRSGNARALRKQSRCGMIQEGEGHWPNSSENLQKARNLWVLCTPQNNKEEGARAKKLVHMRNTRSTRQRSKCAFQRARRLLRCPRAIKGFDGTGTPSSNQENRGFCGVLPTSAQKKIR